MSGQHPYFDPSQSMYGAQAAARQQAEQAAQILGQGYVNEQLQQSRYQSELAQQAAAQQAHNHAMWLVDQQRQQSIAFGNAATAAQRRTGLPFKHDFDTPKSMRTGDGRPPKISIDRSVIDFGTVTAADNGREFGIAVFNDGGGDKIIIETMSYGSFWRTRIEDGDDYGCWYMVVVILNVPDHSKSHTERGTLRIRVVNAGKTSFALTQILALRDDYVPPAVKSGRSDVASSNTSSGQSSAKRSPARLQTPNSDRHIVTPTGWEDTSVRWLVFGFGLLVLLIVLSVAYQVITAAPAQSPLQ